MLEEKPPIVNCHTHVFTSDYVPPYLAKSYVPWPFYYLLSLRVVIWFLKIYQSKIKPIFYTNRYKAWLRFWYKIEIFFKRTRLLGVLKFITEIYLFTSLVYYVSLLFFDLDTTYNGIREVALNTLKWLKETGLFFTELNFGYILLYTFVVLFFFKSIRNLVIVLLKQFKVLPGKNFTDLFYRYLQIGLFSRYKKQYLIYDRLKKQYPIDTHFVALPMDMQYMRAGSLKKMYDMYLKDYVTINSTDRSTGADKKIAMQAQMNGLRYIKNRSQDKNTFHPFVFAHPERMKDPAYFDYQVDPETGEVILDKKCLLYEYIEQHKFSGIKIYPALGYYPFDACLLPLWKYCVQQDIPIMTHCIKGTIFYRGTKKAAWDQHPIFTEGKMNNEKRAASKEKDIKTLDIDSCFIEPEEQPLHLNEVKNRDFCNNFTHPLNYLCLLDPDLLRKVLHQCLLDVDKEQATKLQQIFHEPDGSFRGDLSQLKLCFAHFGGKDQWNKFLETDRDNYTSQLLLQPDKGIDFFLNRDQEPSPGKTAFIWKYVDWYSIICSMILQYDHVYADISYILHDTEILPLLKQTLSNRKLGKKVLYGSDFYVVRNHKSDKAILAEMRAGLTEAEFDQIARYNPKRYLNL